MKEPLERCRSQFYPSGSGTIENRFETLSETDKNEYVIRRYKAVYTDI